MIAIDTNVLIYAHRGELAQHEPAHRIVTALAKGRRSWGVPVFCMAEFIRVNTHAQIFEDPWTLKETLAALAHLFTASSCSVLFPDDAFVAQYFVCCEDGKAIGNLAFDAQIVALCQQRGVSHLISEDRGFRRFRELSVLTLNEALTLFDSNEHQDS